MTDSRHTISASILLTLGIFSFVAPLGFWGFLSGVLLIGGSSPLLCKCCNEESTRNISRIMILVASIFGIISLAYVLIIIAVWADYNFVSVYYSTEFVVVYLSIATAIQVISIVIGLRLVMKLAKPPELPPPESKKKVTRASIAGGGRAPFVGRVPSLESV